MRKKKRIEKSLFIKRRIEKGPNVNRPRPVGRAAICLLLAASLACAANMSEEERDLAMLSALVMRGGPGTDANTNGLTFPRTYQYYVKSNGDVVIFKHTVMGATVGHINTGWRRSRCNSSYEPGASPAWHQRYSREPYKTTLLGRRFCNNPAHYRPGSWRQRRCLSKPSGYEYKHIAYSNENGPWDRSFVCESRDRNGVRIFHDGTSGQAPGDPPPFDRGTNAGTDPAAWGEVFYLAGVMHDHCYHHNPVTHGRSRSFCDNAFLYDMYYICNANYNDNGRILASRNPNKKCKNKADIMAWAVRNAPGVMYDNFNVRADYLRLHPWSYEYAVTYRTYRRPLPDMW